MGAQTNMMMRNYIEWYRDQYEYEKLYRMVFRKCF